LVSLPDNARKDEERPDVDKNESPTFATFFGGLILAASNETSNHPHDQWQQDCRSGRKIKT
jgi:hypothetical protein